MRVPAIFWWPGTIKPAIIHELGSTLDMKATLADLTKATLPEEQSDSYNLTRTLLQGAKSPRQEMFFYRGSEIFAIRKGSYKLHYITQTGYGKNREEHDPPLLFNLELDPGENYNIAAEHPDVIQDINQLKEQHLAARSEVENQLEKR
jgi:arylsulfatase A-like enzyme